MPLQYVKSKQGRDQLLHKGYLFTKERVFKNKTVWRCANYRPNRCLGRAHTCDDRVIKCSDHNHPPREAKRPASSRETTTPPSGPQLTHEAVFPNSGGLSETVPNRKPGFQNVKKRLKPCLSAFERFRAHSCASRQGVCTSQTLSATEAESVPTDPSSSLSIIPPNSHERSEKLEDGDVTATPMLCEEPQASHATLFQIPQEARRQRFRSGTVPPGANPREILSCISETARQWLCPQEHDKDQIVDMVILEQFLAVLPVGLQAWVKAHEPSSSTEAVRLAETYVSEQEPSGASQELQKDSITFEDVSIRFLEEEWALLNLEEKTLHWSVMQQNYDNVAWLTGVEMGSKGEEDFQQETPEPIAKLLEISNKEISWGFKENSLKENHLGRPPESSSEEKDVSDLKETTRGDELELETRKAAKREILLCDYDGCGKIFSNRQNLNHHKKYQHVHQKTFTCSDPSCGKSFNFKKHLKEHEKLHSDKRDYICEFCARSFRTSSNLIIHRRIHTGEKPLQCEICGFTCCQKASLNWHMKKHDAHSFYQFSCDLCGKKFEKKDNVTAHKSKSHPDAAAGPPQLLQEPPALCLPVVMEQLEHLPPSQARDTEKRAEVSVLAAMVAMD